MGENIKQDLRKIAGDSMNTLKDGTELIADVEGALSGNIIQGVKVLTSDIPKVVADGMEDIKDVSIALHDALPSGKSKATLSNGEVLEMKYYETPDTFQARIDKEEAIIAKN